MLYRFKTLILRLLHMEGIMYIIVGCMTTLVNFVIFHVLDKGLSAGGMNSSISYKIAYVVAFITAVIFAYWTNKFWVFDNHNMNPKYLVKEFLSFAAARVISGLLTFVLMIICIDICGLGHTLSWFLTTFINLVFNYVASKFFIFKNKG